MAGKLLPESQKLAKAQLIELDPELKDKLPGGKEVTVQFNPESLKVAFANQIKTPEGSSGDQKNGSPARQFVGAGTTKLTLQLWFDVTAELPDSKKGVADVRELTKDVTHFITPKEEKGKGGKGKKGPAYLPPGVRFLWGSFQFDGLMESLEESLEFFSPDGRPLRASMTLNLSQQKIVFQIRPVTAPNLPTPGTRPLTTAPQGDSAQQVAARQGQGDDWQNMAAANGIENPRFLEPGQLLDFSATGGVSASLDISAGVAVSTPSVQFSASVSLG